MISTRASVTALLLLLPIPAIGQAEIENYEPAPVGLEGTAAPDALTQRTSNDHLSSPFWFQAQAPVWWRDGSWSNDARTAMRVMSAADRNGLNPADYQLQRLSAMLDSAAQSRDTRAVTAADVALSATVLRYLNDAFNGRVDPRSVRWGAATGSRQVETMLADALRSGQFDALVASAGPQTPQYRGLIQSRGYYQRLAAIQWPQVSDGPTLAPGDEGPRVAALREQLALLGDLPEAAPSVRVRTPERRVRVEEAPRPGLRSGVVLTSAGAESPAPSRWEEATQRQDDPILQRRPASSARYDSELEAAGRRFQERHGLNPDGRVGAGTRAALNVPPGERLKQIEANLERLRWMPEQLGDKHIVVNIPSFELRGYEQGRLAIRMPVVVGEPDWQTPVISDEIVNLKFAPTWTIPPNIVKQETLALIRRDPGYLERKNIRVFRNGREISPYDLDPGSVSPGAGYVFRQDPGRQNALGQIRFSLTNPHDIYLHDTPSAKAFGQTSRALSHGCVRVAEPEELALFVVGPNAGWDRKRVETAMNATKTHFHTLAEAVPVHLVYFTSWVDESGRLQFRDDVYGHDKRVLEAVQRRPAWSPPTA